MNILVIGDAILDHYVYGTVSRMSPEDPDVPVLDTCREEYRLGGCMNVAANIRSISAPNWNDKKKDRQPQFTVNLSSVFSEFTGQLLQRKGILCDDSCVLDERKAGMIEPSPRELIKTRFVHEDTEKQLIRVDNRKNYNKFDVDLYKSTLGTMDTRYDAVVISDYAKGLVNGHTLNKLKDFNGPIFIDSKNPDLSFWNDLSSDEVWIKKNEAEWLNSTNTTRHKCVVTKGPNGAAFMCGAGSLIEEIEFKTKPIDSPEVTGAGDVFLAGFVVSYLKDQDLKVAMEFANMCAGLSVKQKGTTEVRLW